MKKSRVYVKNVNNNIKESVKEVMDYFDIDYEDKKVLIKPNLCCAKKWNTGATTDIRLIAEIIKYVKKEGGEPLVGESPICGYDINEIMRITGLKKILDNLKVVFVNLNKDDYGKINGVKIANTYIDSDIIINVPVVKTHFVTGVTISLKNIVGCAVGKEKFILHNKDINKGIVLLNKIRKPDINIIDAIIGLKGVGGPITGEPVKLNKLVASTDPVAADSVASKLLMCNPKNVKHLVMSEENGLGTMNPEIVGDKPGMVFKSFVQLSWLTDKLMNFLDKLGLGFITNKFINLGVNLVNDKRNNEVRLTGKCSKCGVCAKGCYMNAIKMTEEGPIIDQKKCAKCLICVEACPEHALEFKKK